MSLLNSDVLNRRPLNDSALPPSVIESVSAADSVSRSLVQPVAIAESASVADSASSARQISFAVSETASVVDTVSASLRRVGVVSESGAGADSATTLGSFGRQAAETLASADSSVGTIVSAHSVNESAAASDSVVRLFSPASFAGLINSNTLNLLPLNGSASISFVREQLTPTDSSVPVLGNVSVVVESGSAADFSVYTGALVASGVESGSVVDSSGTLFSPQRIRGLVNSDVLNALPLNDVTNRDFVAETLSGADVANGVYVTSLTRAEALSANDVVAGGALTSKTLAEAGSASDAATVVLIRAGAISELASSADATAAALVQNGGVTEAAAASDLQAQITSRDGSVSESVAVGDAQETLFSPRFLGGLINSDLLNLLPLNGVASGEFVYESLAASDLSLTIASNGAVTAESLALTETQSPGASLYAAAADSLTADDSTAALYAPVRAQGLINSDALNLLPLNGNADQLVVIEHVSAADASESIFSGDAPVIEALSSTDSSAALVSYQVAAVELVAALDEQVQMLSPPLLSGLINADTLNAYPLNGSPTDPLAVVEVASAADSSEIFGSQHVVVDEALAATDSAALLYSPSTANGLINRNVLNLLPLNGDASGEFVAEQLVSVDTSDGIAAGIAPVLEELSAGDTSSALIQQVITVSESVVLADSQNVLFAPARLSGLINSDPLNELPLNGTSTAVDRLNASVSEALAANDSPETLFSPAADRGLINTDVLNLFPLNGFGLSVVIAAVGESVAANDEQGYISNLVGDVTESAPAVAAEDSVVVYLADLQEQTSASDVATVTIRTDRYAIPLAYAKIAQLGATEDVGYIFARNIKTGLSVRGA